MSAALSQPAPMTVAEFLAWRGGEAGRTYQLLDGVPVAMNPPSWTHGVIATELAGLLNAHFRAQRSPCRAVVGPGVRPRAGSRFNVRVPDVGVSCDPVAGHLMTGMVVAAEVLSPSNAPETREAVRNYLTIPSVREVLVLDSGAAAGELLRRDPDGAWPEDPLPLGPDDAIVLETFAFRCPLEALYPG